jgi:hypothetical protein
MRNDMNETNEKKRATMRCMECGPVDYPITYNGHYVKRGGHFVHVMEEGIERRRVEY